MSNIFENAYLGKPYKTREGHRALVWYYHVGGDVIDQVVLITFGARQILVDGNGKDLNEPYHDTKYDIVSEWQEPIDTDELDKLANECYYEMSDIADVNCADVKEAFKRGYRKAKQK